MIPAYVCDSRCAEIPKGTNRTVAPGMFYLKKQQVVFNTLYFLHAKAPDLTDRQICNTLYNSSPYTNGLYHW